MGSGLTVAERARRERVRLLVASFNFRVDDIRSTWS